ncbi:hypothetical protein [Spiroplasma endosymbiont of Aspidapion aeneum]|uniref:hypothetical protein n=1 Tax=Spiroplasma endosymbiont of Aspidapion aeneum TaxID=3066276 RepID=UPI00313C3572
MLKENKAFIKDKKWFSIVHFYFKYATTSYFFSPIKCFIGFFVILLVLNMWLITHSVDYFVVPSCVCVGMIRNTTQLFFLQLKQYRESCLHARIKYIKKTLAPYIGFMLSNLLINIIIILLTLGNAFIYKSQRDLLGNINWFYFIFGILLLWLLLISMAYSLYIYSRNLLASYCISITFYIFAVYYLGCAYPYYVIKEYAFIDNAMYFFPPKYIVNVVQASYVNATDLYFVFYKSNKSISVDYGMGHNIWYPILISIGFILLLSFLTILKWKINNIKAQSNFININSIKNIQDKYQKKIAQCLTIDEVNIIHNNFKENFENKTSK